MLRMPSLRRRLKSLCESPLGVRALVAIAVLVLAGCDTGTDAPWLTALDAETHESFFPIASGTHGGADCNACHGRFDTFTRFACTDCHEHSSERTSPVHEGVAEYIYSETSCLDCHPTGAGGLLERGDHTPFFPIDLGSAHETEACRDCHVPGQGTTCVGCHHEVTRTRDAHRRVGGYTPATTSCLKCHFNAEVPSLAQHTFRIDPRTEHGPEEAQCLECHPAELPERPFPSADFGLFACLGCHERGEMDEEHRGERGYAYDSPTCVGCHPTGED